MPLLLGCGSSKPPQAALPPNTPAYAESVAARLRHFRESFSKDVLEKDVARVRPLVEKVLGQSIQGPVNVTCVSDSDWAARKALRLARNVSVPVIPARLRHSNKDRTKADLAFLRYILVSEVYKALSWSLFGKASSRGIEIFADNFHDLPRKIRKEALLLVLAHELAHVYACRRFGDPPSTSVLGKDVPTLARRASEEGFAEYVQARVARELGLHEANDALNSTLGQFALWQPARRQLLDQHRLGREIFVYSSGEEFFAAIAGKLGIQAALERISRRPPTSARQIFHPTEYLAGRTPRHGVLHRTVESLTPILGADGKKAKRIFPVQLQVALDTPKTSAVANVVTATQIDGKISRGELRGDRTRCFLVACTSTKAAAAYVGASKRAASRDRRFFTTPARTYLAFRTMRATLHLDGTPVSAAWRVVRSPISTAKTESLMTCEFSRGAVAVQLVCSVPRQDGWAFIDLCRRIWGAAGPDTGWAGRARRAREPGAAAKMLHTLLGDPDPDVRRAALAATERRGRLGGLSRRQILSLLSDPSEEVRAVMLDGVQDDALLRTALQSEDPVTRAKTLRELARQKSKSLCALFTKALSDSSARVRAAAVHAMAPLSPSIAKSVFLDPSPLVRKAVVESLGEGSRKSTPLGLSDRVVSVRRAAWDHVGVYDRIPRPMLASGLSDPDPVVRAAAFWTCGFSGFISSLRSLTRDDSDRVGGFMKRTKDDSDLVAGYLKRTLAGTDPVPKLQCLANLMFQSTFDPNSIRPFLPEVLHTMEDPLLGRILSSTLPQIVSGDGVVGDDLHGAAAQPDRSKMSTYAPIMWTLALSPECRFGVTEALAAVKEKNSIPVLRELTQDRDSGVRAAALEALRKVAGKVDGFLPKMLEIFKAGRPDARRFAAKALGKLGGSTALKALCACATSSDSWYVRQSALGAAVLCAPKDKRVLGMLEKCLTDPESTIRFGASASVSSCPKLAVRFLGKLRTTKEPSTLTLLCKDAGTLTTFMDDVLDSEKSKKQRQVKREIEARLQELAKSSDKAVAAAAKKALDDIGPPERSSATRNGTSHRAHEKASVK